jgi:hypothetical protein
MAVQAERHGEIGIMGLTYDVMCFKQTAYPDFRDSSNFEPLARYFCQGFQAGVATKKAEGIVAKPISPQRLAPCSPDWMSISHAL